ncbi:unnamed protein product, partial [marine sediment metagenome]
VDYKLNALKNELLVATNHCFLVIDRAGGGKTNLLCELASEQSKINPSLIFFGKDNFQQSDSIIKKIENIICETISVSEIDPVMYFDQILNSQNMFLNIFFDGINENRKIPEFDLALSYFLEW